MKANKQFYTIAAALLLVAGAAAQVSQLNGKDRIVKTNGGIVKGNVKNDKGNEIVYRKYFRKYTIDSDKVLFIMNSNGTVTKINDISMAKNYQNYSLNARTKLPPMPDSIKSKMGGFKPHYVERIGNSFRVDSVKVMSTGEMNDLIGQSPNPIVQLNLKTAKVLRTFTKLTKIMQYPGSAGGAFASYKTFSALFEQMKAGPVTFDYYLKSGLSFLGTLSLPITGAILKKAQQKMYDKTLTFYSL